MPKGGYIPRNFVGDYSPETVMKYVEEEFNQIARAFSETIALELRPVNAEPEKPREGMIVFADGTDWNPGSGRGAYEYNGGAWVKL